MSSDPPHEFRVSLRSRPVRTAFLVDIRSESAEAEIDECIRFSSGLWGGRRNPIIPTAAGEVLEPWWKILKASDPDVVVAFHALNDALLARLNRIVAPGRIIEVAESERYSRGSAPSLMSPTTTRALGVTDIPRYMHAARRVFLPARFFYIHGWSGAPRNHFIYRTLGVIRDESGSLFFNIFWDIPHEEIDADRISTVDLLDRLCSHDRSVTPLELSIEYSQSTFHQALTPQDPFDHIQIVIGDGLLDAIHYWNRGINAFGGIDIGPRTIWLSESDVNDAAVTEAICRWLEKRSLPGPKKFASVFSTTVGEGALRHYSEVLQNRLSIPVMPTRLDEASGLEVGQPVLPRWGLQKSAILLLPHSGVTINAEPPEFLATGNRDVGWMVDVELEGLHPGDASISTTSSLPQRIGVGRALFEGREKTLSARVTNLGLPSSFIFASSFIAPAIHLRLPSALDLFSAAIDWNQSNTKLTHSRRPVRFGPLRVSEKGRYLAGLIRLFGDIRNAAQYFEDPFWSEFSTRLAGDPEQRRQQTEHRLLTYLREESGREGSREVATDERLGTLARGLSGRVALPEEMEGSITMAGLRSIAGQTGRKAREVVAELGTYLARGVVMQGSQVLCGSCGSATWYSVDELATEVRCRGCWTGVQLGPGPKWSFRLNALVREGMRRHGLVPVIKVLGGLFRSGGDELGLLPCLDVREAGSNEVFTDLDIATIVGGEVILGEVKESPEGYRSSDLEKIAAIATEFLPDRVTLWSGPGEWPESMKEPLRLFEGTLRAMGVGFSHETVPRTRRRQEESRPPTSQVG
jgi:hypothetical protein